MSEFEAYRSFMRTRIKFHIHYKDESNLMKLIQALIWWYNPRFLSHYTTVLRNHIYFTNRFYISQRPQAAISTLRHELVHILDIKKWGFFLFAIAYLFPQILALGAISAIWKGPVALWYLLALLPWPAPFRAYFEIRAYAIDILSLEEDQRGSAIERVVAIFGHWAYYCMFPFPSVVKKYLFLYMQMAIEGKKSSPTQVWQWHQAYTSSRDNTRL